MNTINTAPAEATGPDDARADRDIPTLQTKRKTNNVKRLAILAGLLVMVVLIVVGIALFMQRLKEQSLQKKADKAKAQPVATVEATGSLDLEGAKERIKAQDAASQPPADQLTPPSGAIGVVPTGEAGNFASAKMNGGSTAGTGTAGASGAGQGRNMNTGAQYQQGARAETPTERRLSGDVLVSTDSKGMADALPTGSGASLSLPGGPLPGAPRLEKTALQEQLRPTQLEAVAAVRRRSLDYMLLAGTSIPCGQKTLINSTNPGMVSCVVSKDVYSSNGVTKLLERGSEAIGETLQALRLGQEMLPVKWSRIVTPRGVVIDINSLATDSLGASGLPVHVDNHWRERFGAAIMLSLISDLGQAAANKAANAEGTIRLTTSANAGQDLASRALEKTIDIPPTGYSVQGSAVNIFLARDADFGGVYELVKY